MLYLIRFATSKFGTRGMLFLPDGWNCATMEPPWLENFRDRSCIPTGTYQVEIRDSPKYGRVYEVKDVPDRSFIEFHLGNFGGDEELGLRSDTDGCILPGKSHWYLPVNNVDQWAVLSSTTTLAAFMKKMNEQPFELKILGGYGDGL